MAKLMSKSELIQKIADQHSNGLTGKCERLVTVVSNVRPCRGDDLLAIVNAAAEAYRGVIPAD